MNIEAMMEAQEIRMKAAIFEQQLFEAANIVPELQELLGPSFYELEPTPRCECCNVSAG